MLTWECSETVFVHASAQSVWAVWADARKWPVWNTQMKRVAFWGALQEGTKGMMQPLDGAALDIEITKVRPGKTFTIEAKHPQGVVLRFTHTFQRAQDGQPARITHHVEFYGVLAPWLGRTIGKTIKENLRTVLLQLSAQAQMREQAQTLRAKKSRLPDSRLPNSRLPRGSGHSRFKPSSHHS